ncbi:hypothetical protein CTAYLR_005166 [Chrysophaeum taylorii]|uniref:protein disulfide-isomerase n=1 Tax=Chrysophaeum taylorii TaxID=2483200 RepID=A0AAD7XT94_9STRA|nr:hypothetical protein CTAYLR_005166 [Chrysophaeum taylorii]
MLFGVLAAATAAALGSAAAAAAAEDIDTVEALEELEMVAVNFYVDWCEHCRKSQFESVRSMIPKAKTKAPHVLSHYHITQFPSFRLMSYGEILASYDGPYDTESLEYWLSNFRILKNWTSTREFLELEGPKLMGIRAGAELVTMGVPFAYGAPEFVPFDVDGPGVIVFSGEPVWIPGESPNLRDRVARALAPPVTTYDSTFRAYEAETHALWIGTESDAFVEAAIDTKDFRSVYISSRHQRLVDRFGEGLRIIRRNSVYKTDVSTTREDILRFYDDFRHGRLEPSTTSEPDYRAPFEPGKTWRLTGDGLRRVNSSRDIFVAFEAPWCAHSRALESSWDRLARVFAETDAAIARIDATKNDVPGLEISAFPALYLFRKHQPPELYVGDRSFDALLDFLKARLGSDV